MSSEYKPRVGDKIKITHTGTVVTVEDDDWFVIDSDLDSEFSVDGAVIEVLKRDYRVGTVIVQTFNPGWPLSRNYEGEWRTPNGALIYRSDEDVHIGGTDVTVVYEPPAR